MKPKNSFEYRLEDNIVKKTKSKKKTLKERTQKSPIQLRILKPLKKIENMSSSLEDETGTTENFSDSSFNGISSLNNNFSNSNYIMKKFKSQRFQQTKKIQSRKIQTNFFD